MLNEIWYCHAKKGSKKIEPGHWFFSVGQWAHCAQALPMDDGRWLLMIAFDVFGKPLLKHEIYCASLEHCKKHVGDYFGCSIVEKSVREMPGPDSL